MTDKATSLSKQGFFETQEALREFGVSDARTLRKWATKGKLDRVHHAGKVFFKRVSSAPVSAPPKNRSTTKMFKIAKNSSRPTYSYNDETNTYNVFIKGEGTFYEIAAETFREMKEDYSEEGSYLSIAEMAAKYCQTQKWVADFVKSVGWTHKEDIFTDEEILDLSPSALLEKKVLSERKALKEKMDKAGRNRLAKDAEKWNALQESLVEPIGEILSNISPSYSVPKIEFPKVDGKKYICMVTPTDLHYGKYASSLESDVPWDRDICEKLLLKKTAEILAELKRYGAPEYFVVGVGSDWMHIDNFQMVTTKGTPTSRQVY